MVSSGMSGSKELSTTSPFWSTMRYVGRAVHDCGCWYWRVLVKALLRAPGKETYSECGRCETLLEARREPILVRREAEGLDAGARPRGT